ncbi:MAG: Fur family transcriptional regulator [Vulcanimicrobiaceae bacterium]
MRADYATRPRGAIERLLESDRRYLSATQIHTRLDVEQARVSLATVYRTLERLHTKGTVSARVDERGETTYMLCEPEHHHHHAICRICGRVEDVPCRALDEFASALQQRYGFELDGHAMEFSGVCNTCR